MPDRSTTLRPKPPPAPPPVATSDREIVVPRLIPLTQHTRNPMIANRPQNQSLELCLLIKCSRSIAVHAAWGEHFFSALLHHRFMFSKPLAGGIEHPINAFLHRP